MDKAIIERKMFLISSRLDLLEDEYYSSAHPGVEVLLELMSAREFITDVDEHYSKEFQCQELIEKLDNVIELYSQLNTVGQPSNE